MNYKVEAVRLLQQIGDESICKFVYDFLNTLFPEHEQEA